MSSARKERGHAVAALAKISSPRLRTVYPRERLYGMLDSLRDRTVLWLSAPAGAGKTTLIAGWLRRTDLPTIWYQCDEGDADIASFFHFLTLAGQRRFKRRKMPLPQLRPEFYAALGLFTRNYFRDFFARLQPPLVLVLDNWQEVPIDAPLCEMLAIALDEAPVGVTFVVISRAAPPPALSKWATSDQMAVLQWAELKFTEAESEGLAALYASLTGLKALSTSALYDATQGWAAGMALMLRSETSIDSPRWHPSAVSHQGIFDYLSTVIFQRLEPQTRDFLMRTSCLDTVSAAVAIELTKNDAAEKILERLVSANVFTIHRPAACAYQYHPLFRHFLRSRAAATFSVAEQRDLLLRAASIVRSHGDLEGATHLLLSAEAWSDAADLICEVAPQLTQQGRFKTLANWIAAIPEVQRRRQPWLYYWLGECQMATDFAASLATLEDAHALLRRRGDVLGQLLAVSSIIQHHHLSFSVDFRPIVPWIDVLEQLLALGPAFPSPNLELRVLAGFLSVLVLGHPHHPRMSWCLERTQELLAAPVDIPGKTVALAVLMQHYIAAGETEKVRDLVPLIEPLLDRAESGPTSLVYLYYQYAAFNWIVGNATRCHELLNSAAAIAETFGISLLVQIQLSRLHSTDHLRFRDTVATGLQQMQSDLAAAPPHFRAYRLYVQSIFHIAVGELETGLRCAREATRLSIGWLTAHAMTRIATAEALVVAGRLPEAAEQLELVRDMLAGLDMPILEFGRFLVESEHAAHEGNQQRRTAQLEKALAIGRRYGYVHSSVGSQTLLIRQIPFALEQGIASDYCRDLIRKRGIAPPANDAAGWPWTVRIRTLGRFQVWVNDKPLEFSTKVQKKPLELLKALIALGGIQVNEAVLAEILWPDAEGDAARHALGSTVHRLRKLIGEEAVERQEGLLSLRDDKCYVDVRTLEITLGKLRQACKEGCVDTVIPLVERVWSLYQGRFLASEQKLSCALVPREQLQMRLVQRIHAAGQVLLKTQRYEEAERCYRMAIEHDPLVEAFYLGLMESCAARGLDAEALRVYAHCDESLYSGLGAKPSVALRTLAQNIRQGLARN